jgi:ferredoxin
VFLNNLKLCPSDGGPKNHRELILYLRPKVSAKKSPGFHIGRRGSPIAACASAGICETACPNARQPAPQLLHVEMKNIFQ